MPCLTLHSQFLLPQTFWSLSFNHLSVLQTQQTYFLLSFLWLASDSGMLLSQMLGPSAPCHPVRLHSKSSSWKVTSLSTLLSIGPTHCPFYFISFKTLTAMWKFLDFYVSGCLSSVLPHYNIRPLRKTTVSVLLSTKPSTSRTMSNCLIEYMIEDLNEVITNSLKIRVTMKIMLDNLNNAIIT